MKLSLIITFLFSIVTTTIITAQNQNPYVDAVIIISKKPAKSSSFNDQLNVDVYLKNYTVDKGKKACAFYKEFYKKLAQDSNNRLTIYINLWSKKVGRDQINNNALQDKYYKGGINYNYANGKYFEDIYD